MKPTIAVLGAGGWGWNWTERAFRDPDIEAVAFVDASSDVLQRLADRGVPRDRLFESAEQVLAEIPTDAVTCSIPNPQRVPLLLRALEQGRHILVDKPLVHDTETFHRLLEASRDRKTVLMVAQNYRFFHGVQWLKERISSEVIGRIGSMHVHFQKENPYISECFLRDLPGHIPLCVEMSIHHLDMMRFLLGAEPLKVQAAGWRDEWSPGVGYTALDVHLEFPGGVHVAYDANWSARHDRTDWPGHWEIAGGDGALSYGASGRSYRRFDRTAREVESDAGLEESRDTQQSLNQVWARFKASIRNDGLAAPASPFCPIEDNARSLGIAYAIGASIASARTVDVPEFLSASGLCA